MTSIVFVLMVAVRLILVGCGRIGSVHLSYLPTLPRVSLVGLVDSNHSVRSSLAKRFSVPIFTSLTEAVAQTPALEANAVMICTPTATHFELISLALKCQLAVFCEKPIATEIAQIDTVYALALVSNLPLVCGFQRRFDPTFSRLKSSIKSNEIGDVHLLRTCSRDHPLPPVAFLRNSNGLFHDCATHDIDVHRWLLEEDPIEVYAVGSAHIEAIREIGDFDVVSVILKYRSGRISTFDLHRHATYGYDQRIEVVGSLGMLQAENPTRTSMVIANAQGHHYDSCCDSFHDRYRDAYREGTNAFIDVVLGEAQSRIQHEDVRKCSIIATACEESARVGKPIKINY